jgi:peptidyl-prolyl cis-trans isomerase C
LPGGFEADQKFIDDCFVAPVLCGERCLGLAFPGYDCRANQVFKSIDDRIFQSNTFGAYMNQTRKMLVLATLLSFALAGCGQKKGATPAAMKINGQVITASELERQMEDLGMSPDSGNGITGKTMKSMIDKELMRQAAIKENLDKDEDVRASLAAADRMILATAYMQKQVAAIAKPTDAEVSEYYNQHPDFFANRKIYDLQEVAISGKPANEEEIKAKVAKGISLKDYLHWLGQKKIQYSNQQIPASTDQMREEVAKKLKDAQVGQAIPLDGTDQITALFINSVQTQPVTLAQASPRIMKRLFNSKMSETMENQIKKLHDEAKIEYVAPFTENGRAPKGQ